LQGAGLSRGNWLLDIGCGSAHWLLAALDGCEKVSGVELSPEYVALASGLVKARGLDERMSVVEGSAETLPFPSGQFDRALSHSVLHFVDAERAFAEVRRVLSPEGLFYCAATGPGARIAIALSAIQGDKKPAAKAALRILLGGAIRLSGLASPPWSSTRALNLGSYIKIGEACGFSLVRTPDVQDIIRGVPNFPGTFDVLFVKGAAPFSAREHFTQALATAGCSTSDFFEHLLRNSMPGLVYRAVIEDWASLDPTARAIWLGRSELAGSSTPSPRHLDAAAAAMQPLAREVFMGLRALGAGRPAAARQHFAAAGDEGDAPLLLATLDLNTNTERAHRRFRQLAEAQPERLWSWAGLLMSALMGGKASEIQRAAALARARLHSGVAHRV
jgi:SAM-dependent methyltransferase